MYVGKIIPLHAGSASRVLLAWNPELAERILAAPLEPLTDGTVTSPEELRKLIAQAKADGYAITRGRTRGFCVRAVRAGIRLRGRHPGRDDDQRTDGTNARDRSARYGSTCWSATPSRSPAQSAAAFRAERAKEPLRHRLHTVGRRGGRHGFPLCQNSSPPHRSCNSWAGSRIAIRSCHAPTMRRRCGRRRRLDSQ